MINSHLKVVTTNADLRESGFFYRIWYFLKKDRTLHIMILPCLIGFILFRYVPIYGMLIAFQKYDIMDGFFGSPWVGFDNFITFFKDPYFFRLIRNTFLLSFYSLLFGFPIPIIFALMLNEVKKSAFKKVTQSISYLPHFIPVVVMVGIMYEFFGSYGNVNELLANIGLSPQHFLGDNFWFRPLYVSSGLWQEAGWNSIIYLAALSALNPVLYEAAIIDGANRWKQMLHVTLPGLLPTITILFILNVGTMLNVGFEKVYLMYSPAVYETGDVLSTYVFRRGIEGMDFSYGTTVDLFNGIISLILVLSTNYLVRSTENEGIF